jgi:cytochrome oxidase assembly protein ShyY1
MRAFLCLFRRPSWVAFTAFVVLASVGFYELGVWQLHRHTHQNRIDAELRRSKALAPVPVASLLSAGVPPAQATQWRRVTATGTYDASHQLLVRNRVLQNANGYEVLVPLRTSSGIDLLVDRGWIPSGPTALAPATIPAVPSGTVAIMGRIRPPEGARSNAGVPSGQTQRIVPAQVATNTGRPTYGGFVDLVSETPKQANAPTVLLSPDQQDSGDWWKPPHLAYAIQWFLFIGIAAVGWGLLARRELALNRQAAAAD